MNGNYKNINEYKTIRNRLIGDPAEEVRIYFVALIFTGKNQVYINFSTLISANKDLLINYTTLSIT